MGRILFWKRTHPTPRKKSTRAFRLALDPQRHKGEGLQARTPSHRPVARRKAAGNWGASSKAARFIRRRRRFAAFPFGTPPKISKDVQLSEIMSSTGRNTHFFEKGNNCFNFLKASLIVECFIRLNITDFQKHSTGGIGHQTAVEFLLLLHKITPVQFIYRLYSIIYRLLCASASRTLMLINFEGAWAWIPEQR